MLQTFHPRGLALAVAIGVLIAACGGTSSDTAVPSSTSVAPAATSTTAAPTTTSSTTTTDPGFIQAEGEIFLEPAGSQGPDSFTGESFAEPATTSTSTTAAVTPPPEPSGPTTVEAVVGDTPALYGGSRDRAVCDMAGQLRFLERNPDKAAAFVAGLNSDPNLMWSGGTSVTVAQLADYWEELTPMVLTRDTRVTNHGYRNGRPTPRQAVLQAGTAVLVDAYGVPRVRCECGNPLAPPRPVPVAPVYTGPVWPEFNPATIIVINQTTVIIEQFILIDIATGEEFVRPAGSDGISDAAPQAWIWQIDLEASEPGSSFAMDVAWSGEFTIAEDETISGTGQGTWTLDADCTVDGTGEWMADLLADGTFTVSLTGQATTTEIGRVANILPRYSDIAIASESWTSPQADCEEDFYTNIDLWVEASIAPIEGIVVESEPVYASYQNEVFSGSVTLTPIG